MKNLIEWTPDLAVNVPVIDDQHKELYSRMNDLCNAIMEGKGRNEVGSFVRYLSEYTTFHFEAEEALMRQHEYPGYDAQRAAHRLFREKVGKMAVQADADVIALRPRCDCGRGNEELVLQSYSHLGQTDRRFPRSSRIARHTSSLSPRNNQLNSTPTCQSPGPWHPRLGLVRSAKQSHRGSISTRERRAGLAANRLSLFDSEGIACTVRDHRAYFRRRFCDPSSSLANGGPQLPASYVSTGAAHLSGDSHSSSTGSRKAQHDST